MVKRKLFDWAMDSQNTDGRYYIIQSCSQRWWYIMKDGQLVRMVDTWHEALTYFQDGKVKCRVVRVGWSS